MRRPVTPAAALLAALATLAAPGWAQTTITTLPTLMGTEGDQWHVTYTPAKRIKGITFTDTATPPGAPDPARIRPIRFLALDSGNSTDREERTVCLDADGWTDVLDGDSNVIGQMPDPNHDCENEHTIPAYSEPAVVPCTATDYSLDCTGQTPLPDSVRISIVSIDDSCRNAGHGVVATATFADGTTATGRWTLTDDDLFPC